MGKYFQNILENISSYDILIVDISINDIISIYSVRYYMEAKSQKDNIKAELPLTESTLLILLALGKAHHGYGIMQEIQEMTDGAHNIGPGTLYGVLKQLVKKKLVVELPSDNPRRRNYRLGTSGEQLIELELERLETLLTYAHKSRRNGEAITMDLPNEDSSEGGDDER
jgi:DNA-binding PadR family transcriptional regulator